MANTLELVIAIYANSREIGYHEAVVRAFTDVTLTGVPADFEKSLEEARKWFDFARLKPIASPTLLDLYVYASEILQAELLFGDVLLGTDPVTSAQQIYALALPKLVAELSVYSGEKSPLDAAAATGVIEAKYLAAHTEIESRKKDRFVRLAERMRPGEAPDERIWAGLTPLVLSAFELETTKQARLALVSNQDKLGLVGAYNQLSRDQREIVLLSMKRVPREQQPPVQVVTNEFALNVVKFLHEKKLEWGGKYTSK